MINVYVEGAANDQYILEEKRTFFQKLRGLLFTNKLPENTGVILYNTNYIHTIGMRYAIDCIFINSEFEVMCTAFGVLPGTVVPRCKQALHVIELSAHPKHKKVFKKHNKVII